jgi:hypothetical protein
VLQQHLGQPQVAVHGWADALPQRGPGGARLGLHARLELRLAQADDHDLVAGIQLVQALPGLQRAAILPRTRRQRRQLLQRAPVPAEVDDRLVERRRGLGAVAVPRLAFDQIDDQLRIVGQAPDQLLEHGGPVVLVAQLIV